MPTVYRRPAMPYIRQTGYSAPDNADGVRRPAMPYIRQTGYSALLATNGRTITTSLATNEYVRHFVNVDALC